MVRRRVLLISPVRGVDVASGDVVYTESLLAEPPGDTVYETYDRALERGTLVEHGTRAALRRAAGRTARAWEMSRFAARAPIGAAKRRGLLYREPVRFFSVEPGAYDLVHVHVFNTRFVGLDCPLVVSHALPLENLYRDAFGWSPRRAAHVERLERAVGAAGRLNMFSTGPLPQVARAIALTPYVARRWREAGVPDEMIDLVPIHQPKRPKRWTGRPRTLAIMANDLPAKGGAVLFQAFDVIARAVPGVRLLVIGSERSSGPEVLHPNVEWRGRVARAELLQVLREEVDVVCHPSNFDGLPLVVLEAMSFGIPTIVSDYAALPYMAPPELVVPQRDATALAAAAIGALDPARHAGLVAATEALFAARFASGAVLPQLERAYDAAGARTGTARQPVAVAT